MRLDRPLPQVCIGILFSTLAGSAFLASESPQASPDFSLTAGSSALNLTAAGSPRTILVRAAATGGFNGAIEVKVSNLPRNVTATPGDFFLNSGESQEVILQAPSAAAGAAAVRFTGASGGLHHAAEVHVTVKVDVVTQHNNNARTGLNASETILTPASVDSSRFGLLRTLPVNGTVDAQPLLLSSLAVKGVERDVLFVETEADTVYAFDAETGSLLWKRALLGEDEIPSSNLGCKQFAPEVGITATPVIDRKAGAHGAIFVVALSFDRSGIYHQRLYALDVTTGAELEHSPAEIHATFPGRGANSANGRVVFDPAKYVERAGLLLVNGTIYMSWGARCDRKPYTGWLMGYSESTLEQTGVLNVTPNGSDGGIWMAGAGLAADDSGSIYFLDGNGTFDTELNAARFPVHGDYGNGFIKVSTADHKLEVADYFEMSNTVSESQNDADLGSGGAMLLPDLKDNDGNVHHLAVGAGKDSNIYVVDRDSMGRFNPSNDSAIYEEIDSEIRGVWTMPAYYNNTVFYGAAADALKAIPISNAKLERSPRAQTPYTFRYPGTNPSISANGATGGIVWAVENTVNAILHAYLPFNLTEIYNSNQAPHLRDRFGYGGKFITPTIANGHVYIGSPGQVAVFGLLP